MILLATQTRVSGYEKYNCVSSFDVQFLMFVLDSLGLLHIYEGSNRKCTHGARGMCHFIGNRLIRN